MSDEYLLACPACGTIHAVAARNAGEKITCQCGASVEVPRLRELRQLPLKPKSGPAPATKPWGARQGLMFVGAVLMVGSLALAGAFRANLIGQQLKFEPTENDLEQLQPSSAWEYWNFVRQGMPERPTSDLYPLLEQTRYATKASKVALGFAPVGLFLIIVGLLVPQRKVSRD